eukprot:364389-Chlamydomonas_euryale.AAC.1
MSYSIAAGGAPPSSRTKSPAVRSAAAGWSAASSAPTAAEFKKRSDRSVRRAASARWAAACGSPALANTCSVGGVARRGGIWSRPAERASCLSSH